MNLMATLLAMFDRPAKAMEAVVQRPRRWWLPALLLVLSTLALTYFSAPMQVALANERTAQMIAKLAASMSEEQARMVQQSTQAMTVGRFMLTGVGVGVVLLAVGWFIRSGIYHLSSLALGQQGRLEATLAVTMWATLPLTVRNLVQTAFTLIQQKPLLHGGLAFVVASGDWLADSRSIVYALLSSIDLFVLWQLALTIVGVAASTKLSRGKATVLVLVVWIVGLGLRMVPVALSAALSSRLMGG